MSRRLRLVAPYCKCQIRITLLAHQFAPASPIPLCSITLFFLFGGIFIDKDSMPEGWQWFYFINPISYGTNVLASLQLYCEGEDCPTVTITDLEEGETVMDRYEYASDAFSFDYDRRWEYTGYVALIMVLVRVAGLLALKYINHVKR